MSLKTISRRWKIKMSSTFDFLSEMDKGHNSTFFMPEREARDYMAMIKSSHDDIPNLYVKVNACSVTEVVVRVDRYIKQMASLLYQMFGIDTLSDIYSNQQDGKLGNEVLAKTYDNMGDDTQEIIKHMSAGLQSSIEEIAHRLHSGERIEDVEWKMLCTYDMTNILVYEISEVDMFMPTDDEEKAIIDLIGEQVTRRRKASNEEEE